MEVDAPEMEQAMGIGLHIQLQVVDHAGRDPACAEFQPRESLFVEYNYLGAASYQLPSSGRPCRAASNNEHVASLHGIRRFKDAHVTGRSSAKF